MGLFDFLRTKKVSNDAATGSYVNTSISNTDLRDLINDTISVFENNPGHDHNQLIDLIKTYRNDEDLAMALYRFIPIAYCRLFIPEPTYSDEYIVYRSEKDNTTFFLSTDTVYQAVLRESRTRLATTTAPDAVMSVLYHSADFKAINEALNNGSELTNLVCSPAYFL